MKNNRLSILLLAILLFPPGVAWALKIAVISDLNGSYGSTRYDSQLPAAIASVISQQPALVISTGDMVAGQRQPLLSETEIRSMWRSFDESVTVPLRNAGLRLAVTPGNHDGSAQQYFSLERELYRQHWLANRPALAYVDDTHYPFYYAFTEENVLFISLDVTLVKQVELQQKTWLANLLKEQGKNFTHRIVFSHLPLWASAQGRENDISADTELETILKSHGVDLYLSGHHHTYYPGFHNGIGHIHQACLGSGRRKLLGTDTPSPQAFTVIELDEKAGISVKAYTGRDYQQLIDNSSLPEKIVSREATLIRYDLAVE